MNRTKVPELGPKIQAVRKSLRYSLDDLALKSGVSKSMLSQIERGEANPTFATLWNLTHALELDLSDLVSGQANRDKHFMDVVPPTSTPEIKTADGLCILRILSAPDSAGSVEWYEIIISPNGSLKSKAHSKGSLEHLTVIEGKMIVKSGDTQQQISKGMTVRYSADVSHSITNAGKCAARAFLVVVARIK